MVFALCHSFFSPWFDVFLSPPPLSYQLFSPLISPFFPPRHDHLVHLVTAAFTMKLAFLSSGTVTFPLFLPPLGNVDFVPSPRISKFLVSDLLHRRFYPDAPSFPSSFSYRFLLTAKKSLPEARGLSVEVNILPFFCGLFSTSSFSPLYYLFPFRSMTAFSHFFPHYLLS